MYTRNFPLFKHMINTTIVKSKYLAYLQCSYKSEYCNDIKITILVRLDSSVIHKKTYTIMKYQPRLDPPPIL